MNLPFFNLYSSDLIPYMGAAFSGRAWETTCGDSYPSRTTLGDVPESCVSSILMFLDPPDICKVALLNRAFHGASLADFVWEIKLPSNYRFVARKVFQENSESFTKKHMYARLCQLNNFFDDGTKQVWLDKSSGKICLSISYKGLKITGIDDRRYWNHIASEESRFQTIAYLQQIWWFEVAGEVEFEFPPGTYSLFFRLQLGKPCKRSYSRRPRLSNSSYKDQVHGWDIKPVRFKLSTSNGHHASSECCLHDQEGIGNDWIHVHVGNFVIEDKDASVKINFSMMQIDCTHTKGGLCLDSVLICPPQFAHSFISTKFS